MPGLMTNSLSMKINIHITGPPCPIFRRKGCHSGGHISGVWPLPLSILQNPGKLARRWPCLPWQPCIIHQLTSCQQLFFGTVHYSDRCTDLNALIRCQLEMHRIVETDKQRKNILLKCLDFRKWTIV